MASWVRRAGWIVLAVAVIVLALGINPWFALVVAPALLVAAGSASRETRAAVPTGELLAEIRSLAEIRHAHLARRVVLAIGVAVAGLFAVVLSFQSGGRFPEPPRPSIDLPATYAGTFGCDGRCIDWAADHTLTIVLSAERARIADVVAAGLGDDGWPFPKRTAVGDEVHLRFKLTGSPQSTPVRWWPLRTTGTLALPRPIPAGDVVATLPPGPEAAALARPLSRDAFVRGLDIYLDLGSASMLTLTFPRLAVAATAPASDPHDIAGGRQQRVLPLGGGSGATVSLDLMSPLARSDGAAKFAALGTGGWGWLVVTGLSGLLIKRVRTFAGTFARSVLERIKRRRRPPRRAGRTGRPTRPETAGARRRKVDSR